MAKDDIVKYQFSKGVSGNPNGRPAKEFSITGGIREYLAEDDLEKKKTRKDIIVEKVVSMALRGDKEMIKYVIDRLEGAPRGSAPNTAVQINHYVGTPEQDAEILEQEILDINAELARGKLKIIEGKVSKNEP